jgi:hypothetical protein
VISCRAASVFFLRGRPQAGLFQVAAVEVEEVVGSERDQADFGVDYGDGGFLHAADVEELFMQSISCSRQRKIGMTAAKPKKITWRRSSRRILRR